MYKNVVKRDNFLKKHVMNISQNNVKIKIPLIKRGKNLNNRKIDPITPLFLGG